MSNISPITRRQALAALTAPAWAAPNASQKAASGGKPPNILLILADDLAAWMLGCYGNKEIRTPNIDRLAGSGVRFHNHFVVTPICSASRATLFTGRVPRQHGIHDFLTANPVPQPPQGQKEPPASFAGETMISDLLAAKGYQCGYVGKWHMGNDANPGHGYQHTYTMGGGSSRYQDPAMFLNGKPVQEKGYLTELMTWQAAQFLDRQNGAKPFFLTVSYFNPHTPYDGHPQKYYDLYANTNFETIGWEPAAPHALREKNLLTDTVGNLRKCAASTTALDDQIPVLLQKLRQRGLADNTLVIFTGDNGFLLGRHGLWSKGLASDPINMYEEVMQVPMLMHWPGKLPVQATRPELVSYYDFLPTVCEAAGADVPASGNLYGRSYLPLAMGKPPEKKKPWPSYVFGHFRNTEMARDSRHKLVWRNNGAGPNELFDLRTDPMEKRNEYENPQFLTVRDRMAQQLAQWRKKST
ncbi:MAG: sulfatase-like hydrolase/transferase [Acidobacteriia bacterium]|nr:sulfatase-like hydrolase/transferase [Terriglobia bacterium]